MRSSLFAASFVVLVSCAEGLPHVPPERPTESPAPPKPVEAAQPESPRGGMWIPKQLADHAPALEALGLELPLDSISNPTAHPLGAIISLGGCSASFVSPDGLIATNHHCVTGSLQYNTTKDENLLEDGFLAKTRADEKWNGPTSRVYVTQSFVDVTNEINDGLTQITDDKTRYDTVEQRIKDAIAECEKSQPNTRCSVASYFGGAERLLITRLEIQDVRLVYAPHRGIGEFGGEIDNWMWPRHTGDFSFYRAYVGPDGKPAKYSEKNVPYEPPHHLRLPSKPLTEGDLVLVAGYPGRTSRNKTAWEVAEAVEWNHPSRVDFCRVYLSLIERLGNEDAEVKRKAAPFVFGLKNALKYYTGSLEGLTKGGAADERKSAEQRLRQWVSEDPARKEQWGGVFDQLEKTFAARVRTREADRATAELVRVSNLLGAATTIVRMAKEREKPDAKRDPQYQKRNWERLEARQKRLEKTYVRKLDHALLELALSRAARLAEKDRPEVLATITGSSSPSEADIEKAVDRLYSTTKLEDTKGRVELLKSATQAQLAKSRDPMIRLAVQLDPILQAKEDREDAFAGAMVRLRPAYIAALRALRGTRFAPDANGTLRVTFGTVRGYRPKAGADEYRPFTVLSEVVAKSTDKKPFHTPSRLLETQKAKQFGAHVDPKLGEVPVNFLSDVDTTGGNSGSATLNGRGELVGLLFDGNYEAMASDWLYMPDITRSIHVDIRYALWVMQMVDGAGHLLEEMGLSGAAEQPK